MFWVIASLIVLGIIIGVLMFRPLWIMNYLAPRFHCKRVKDLPYAQDARHTLDLYVPKHIRHSDVLVFIHGGAWDTGHKNEYQFAGLALAELGYVSVVPNYRLYPQVRFPHFIEDVAQAIASLPQHLSLQGIETSDPLSIILIGHSAGAHTAAMLASDTRYLAKCAQIINVKACIGLAGPYDLPLDDPLVVGKFDGIELHDIAEQQVDLGHEHNAHEANPINFAHTGMPDMCLIHGLGDVTVGPYHSERFMRMLNYQQVPCEHITYEGVNHRHLVGGLSIYGRLLNPVFQDISQFLSKLNSKSA
ncbi:MAG: alpha/beta hydrolase [Gammaproteobacteria bacterium]|nr:alpha/beta hydrolase [Gammaproteobacteria bacterium]